MKICILDGSRSEDQIGERIHKSLILLLNGHQVQHFFIREMRIAPCMGDFLCWTKTSGICKNKDDNLLIAETMAQCELLILLTPITFGGYSSLLKQGLDHLIQNISPFFAKVQGETHHKKRYASYPNLAVIGWDEEPDIQQELIFKHLVVRNSINLYAQKTYCELFHPEDTDDKLSEKIRGILDGSAPQLEHQILPIQGTYEKKPPEKRKQTPTEPQAETGIKKALLLVGSPRKEQSSSLSLGSYLCSRLQQHAIETEKVLLYAKGIKENQEKVFAKIDKADLVILVFPLYIDSLPSPVIEFLEQLVHHRDTNRTTRKHGEITQFVALSNCGFPEAKHNDTALAIAEQFSLRAGFLWRGGLGVGGGNGFGGRSLEEGKQATVSIRQALDLASEALAKGEPIPQVSVDLAAKEPYPSSLFRFGAQFFWKAAAAKHGAKKKIQDRPYSGE